MNWSPEEIAARQVGIDPLLLESLCWWETRGERTRGREDAAHGDGGLSRGRCQVQVGTAAWQLGLTALDLQENPALVTAILRRLHDGVYNARHASIEAKWCLDHRSTVERAIACYQGGRWAIWRGPTQGTKNVLSRYAAAKLRREHRG